MSKNETIPGYDLTECSKCSEFGYRKLIGISPNRRRKYYMDNKRRTWRGKMCPDCCRKRHTEYMRQRRSEGKDTYQRSKRETPE